MIIRSATAVALGVLVAACSRDRSSAASAGTAATTSPSAAANGDEARRGDQDGGVTSVVAADGGGDASAPSVSACPPSPLPSVTADVDVTIRADRGPLGAASPREVDRKIFGMNIADWRPLDYSPSPSAAFSAYLAALRPGLLRWPAGHRSQEYVWTRGGAGQSGDWTLEPEHIEAFLALAKSVSAKPVIGINTKRGTPAAAADLVRYLNVEQKHGIEWLYIGNEPDLVDDMTPSPEVYAEQLVAYVDAIRAVDASVRFVGPELMTGAHVGGIDGTLDWMTPILTRGGSRLSAISWHYYPVDSGQPLASSSATPTIAHLLQESASDWHPAGMSFVDTIMPMLASLRDAHAPGAEIWVTELAEDPGPKMGAGISDTISAALWSADALGRYVERGATGVLRFLFKGDPAHVYGLIDTDEKPRVTYGAYWLYARDFGDRVVDATTSALAEVAAHAALRPDGRLAVVFVNKSESPRRVRVAVSGACTMHAVASTLEGGGDLGATTFSIDGRSLDTSTLDDLAPLPVAGDPLVVDMPPASMRIVLYGP